ncbi:hypothetical protein [Halomonas sp. A29]|uniref:hypothetical protein n=1 Tax=Halomonas sp. A29 TaxID=3102786 RepID=UPI00398B61CC
MPPLLEALLALAMVALATLALLDRQLVRACTWFVLFALVVALAWARLGLMWLALLEAVLGATFTGAFLFHALGVTRYFRYLRRHPLGCLIHRHDPELLIRRLALVSLLPALAVLAMLGVALVAQGASPLGSLRPAGLGLLGLGLWAFALHRHLLRRLLAFNIIGTGIFLVLMSLVGENAMTAAHGLVITGLLVALLGTVLGALLIRRLERLEQAGEMRSAKGNGAS